MVGARSFLIPFRYSHKVSYVVEFSHRKIRLYAENNLVRLVDTQENNGPNYFDQAGFMGVGQVEINGVLASNNSNVLDDEIFEIVSPYSYDDLWDNDELCLKIQTIQNCDILYIFHENYPIHMLKRYANNDWRLEQLELHNGPFMAMNTTDVDIRASATMGDVVLSASSTLFKPTDVGRLVRFYAIEDGVNSWVAGQAINTGDVVYSDKKYYQAINNGTTGLEKPCHFDGVQTDGGVQWRYLHDGSGTVKIIRYNSGTSVLAKVIRKLPSGVLDGTVAWELGLLHDGGKYPISGAFFKNRFAFLVNTENGPNVCLSVSGDYNNFTDREAGDTTAETAITVPVLSKEFNEGKWLIAGDVLFVGTGAAEFYIDAISQSTAMSSDNVKILQISSVGSKAIQPVMVGAHIFLADRYGLSLRDLLYNYYNEGYDQVDMSLLGKHLFYSRIVAMSYQETPDKILWCLMGDGTLSALTFSAEQEVAALSRHDFSGEVESIAVVTNLRDCRDELWIEVRRIINGQVVRSVELVENGMPQTFPLSVADVSHLASPNHDMIDYVQKMAFYLDGAVLFVRDLDDDTEFMAGLNHLEGEKVLVFADGAVLEPQIVVDGKVKISKTDTYVLAGLPIYSQYIPQNMYLPTNSSSGVGQKQRINHILFSFYLSGGGMVGQDRSSMVPILYRSSDAVIGVAQGLFTGNKEILFNGSTSTNNEAATIFIENTSPLPMNILALVPSIDVSER